MNSKLKKIVALICIPGLLMTGSQNALASPRAPQVIATASDFPTDLAQLAIPETLGTIEEAFLTGGNRTVILIQDAHAVPEAQNNIRKLISYFQKEYGAGAVAVEGASGPLDTFFLRKFPDPALLKKTMRGYHERAELSGASAAALFDPGSGGYYGVEDWPLYEEGVALYQEASKKQQEIQDLLKSGRESLDLRKATAYSPKLRAFDKQLEHYQAHGEKLAEMLQEADRLLPVSQGAPLEALIQQIRAADTADEKLQQETRRALQEFRDRLNSLHKTMPSSLNSAVQSFETGEMSAAEFAFHLKQAAVKEKAAVFFSAELLRQVRMQKKLSQIKGSKLYEDLRAYLQQVKESLMTTPEQKS
nr:hypothetical protein [Candidatus Omnitrophota bacterium]